MKKNYPVMWVEGMPINQHVFQQEYIYNQVNLKNLFSSFCPNNFGVIDIEWNTNQLNNDILYLKSLKAILPNFLYVTLEETDNVFINLNSSKNILKSKELFVFLNISKDYKSKQSNDAHYSYELLQQEVNDLNNRKNKFYYLKNKKSYSFYKEMGLYILTKIIYTLETAILSDIHPEELFKILNNLLTESLFFQNDKQLIIMQKYDHTKYYDLLNNLIKYINNSIDNIYESYTQSRFIKEEKGCKINLKNTKIEEIKEKIKADKKKAAKLKRKSKTKKKGYKIINK